MSASAEQLIGRTVIGQDGSKIGHVNNVLVDEQNGQPEFLSVRTGLFGMRESIVPFVEAMTTGDDDIAVPYTQEQVKDAPNFDADHALDPQEEQALYQHYGLVVGGGQAAAEAGHDTSGPNTDDAMTRSEERLHVGKETVETGRVRLRKYVVTEQVQQTVPVTHEEVRLEREPITDANIDKALDGPAISEEEHEVVLHAERPVVAKETVPVERVRLSTDQVTEQAQVDEQVRKEQITTDNGVYPADDAATSRSEQQVQR